MDRLLTYQAKLIILFNLFKKLFFGNIGCCESINNDWNFLSLFLSLSHLLLHSAVLRIIPDGSWGDHTRNQIKPRLAVCETSVLLTVLPLKYSEFLFCPITFFFHFYPDIQYLSQAQKKELMFVEGINCDKMFRYFLIAAPHNEDTIIYH